MLYNLFPKPRFLGLLFCSRLDTGQQSRKQPPPATRTRVIVVRFLFYRTEIHWVVDVAFRHWVALLATGWLMSPFKGGNRTLTASRFAYGV